ncbi:Hint domain-containing protein [Vannielia sp.]|uniref:Hint domain-containing protein n=1 Tax=Vannielia sp. TaxID=2813045 RepID=UPI003BACF47F
MATIFDLVEVTDLTGHTTYSDANGNILGVVDGMTSADLNDGEFDEGDSVSIGGVTYTVSHIQEPDTPGHFELRGGVIEGFAHASESNLNVMFLTLTNGAESRHFILPNDSYGDMEIVSITTGALKDVTGSDAAVIGTADNAVGIICFAAGTMIEGGCGASRPVEQLRPGDMIRTADHGLQPLRWRGHCHLGAARLRRCPHLAPIRIAPGALGEGRPNRPLLVSPQHRLLMRSRIAGRMFGVEEVLVAARRLLPLPGISQVSDMVEVDYFHLLFDRHEVIFANGAPAESLFTGPAALKALEPAAHAEVLALFPALATLGQPPPPGRPIVEGKRSRSLIARHLKNRKPPLRRPPG